MDLRKIAEELRMMADAEITAAELANYLADCLEGESGTVAMAQTVNNEAKPRINPMVMAEYDPRKLEVMVTEIIHEIGVPAHIKGYRYLRSAIILAVTDHGIMECITKELYPKVAEEFDTTASRVERAIRHAIEVAWDRCDTEVLQKWFGNTISSSKGKPTNSEFIALILYAIRI